MTLPTMIHFTLQAELSIVSRTVSVLDELPEMLAFVFLHDLSCETTRRRLLMALGHAGSWTMSVIVVDFLVSLLLG